MKRTVHNFRHDSMKTSVSILRGWENTVGKNESIKSRAFQKISLYEFNRNKMSKELGNNKKIKQEKDGNTIFICRHM